MQRKDRGDTEGEMGRDEELVGYARLIHKKQYIRPSCLTITRTYHPRVPCQKLNSGFLRKVSVLECTKPKRSLRVRMETVGSERLRTLAGGKVR